MSTNLFFRTLTLSGAYLFASLLFAPVLLSADEGQALYVQVRKTALRSEPDYLASKITELGYGSELRLVKGLEEDAESGWYKVSSGKLVGFVNSSAVSEEAIDSEELQAMSRGSAVKGSDIVLASKGMDEEREAALKKENPDLNFAAVDEIDRQGKPSESELRRFANDGQLSLQN